jgi:hypothetical protein
MSGTIETYSFTEEQLSEYMQDVKAVIMWDLYDNDLISDKVYEDYTRKKFLVLRKPSFFTRLWKKCFTYEYDRNYIILATAENLMEREKDYKPGESSKPDLKVIPLPEKNSE